MREEKREKRGKGRIKVIKKREGTRERERIWGGREREQVRKRKREWGRGRERKRMG